MRRFYELIRPGLVPFVLAALVAILIVVNSAFDIYPSSERFAAYVRSWYESYGLLTLVGAGLIEGLFMIGLYFPGSFIIILLVFIAPKTPASLLSIILVGWFTFTAISTFNFFLGRYGLYRVFLALGGRSQIERLHKIFERWGWIAIFVLAINPTYLAILLICAGIARAPALRTLLITGASLLLWITAWTALIASVSFQIDLSQQGTALDWIFVGILLIVGCVLIWRGRHKRLRGLSGKNEKPYQGHGSDTVR